MESAIRNPFRVHFKLEAKGAWHWRNGRPSSDRALASARRLDRFAPNLKYTHPFITAWLSSPLYVTISPMQADEFLAAHWKSGTEKIWTRINADKGEFFSPEGESPPFTGVHPPTPLPAPLSLPPLFTLLPCPPGPLALWRPALLSWLAVTLWLVSGCQGLGAQPTNVPLNLTAFLPPEWQPVGELYEIDVDEDAVTEYLMLYTYDQTNGSGPVGALIFDPQVEAVVGDGGRLVTGRPAGSPNPYALLPSYWGGAGQGYIAAPSQKESVTVRQVAHQPILSVEQAPKPDVLVLRGGNNYLTFIWWKNVVEGYGVTQLYAPGWFAGIDWSAWDALPQPIQTIVGIEPRNDRSQICRQTQYTLVETPIEEQEQGVFRQAIRYTASDLGIAFCFGSPAHPFYPEGVVLAYLTDASKREQLLIDTVRDDLAARTRLTDLFNPDLLVRVDEVLGYPTIPLTVVDAISGGSAVRTTVCVQLWLRKSAESAEVEPRWLLFTLEHRPPQLQPPAPDRLYIANLNAIPAPAEGVGMRCADMIDVNN